jgi:putative phosphoesterase
MKPELNVFGLSDTHFLHDNILKFTYENDKLLRPEFASLEDMNNKIRASWNNTVRDTDMVVHVGDFIWTKGNSERMKELIKTLNGRIILVRGNHDKKSYSWYMSNGIQFVCDRFSWDFNGKRVLFVHNPDHVDSSEYSRYDIIFHGHVHRNRPFLSRVGNTFVVNLSVEQIKYRPIALIPLMNRIYQGYYKI